MSSVLLVWGWGFDYTDPGSFYSDFRWVDMDGCWNKKKSWRKGKKQGRANYQRKQFFIKKYQCLRQFRKEGGQDFEFE